MGSGAGRSLLPGVRKTWPDEPAVAANGDPTRVAAIGYNVSQHPGDRNERRVVSW
jgi:hypothetical protein